MERRDEADVLIVPHEVPYGEEDRTAETISDQMPVWTDAPRGYLRAIAAALIS